MKKPSISTIVIFIIILLAVGGLIFLNGTKEINAPTDTDTASTTGNLDTTISTSTTGSPAVSGAVKTNSGATANGDTKVIYGDGFKAEVTKVPTNVILPEINSFKLDSTSSSGVCRFSWDVSKAETCNFINVTTNMEVKAAGDEGIIQTSEKGDYQLKCMGKQGGSIKSEVVSCK